MLCAAFWHMMTWEASVITLDSFFFVFFHVCCIQVYPVDSGHSQWRDDSRRNEDRDRDA